MKVIEETDARLVLRHFPAFSIACCALFAGGLSWLAVTERTEIETWKWATIVTGAVLATGMLFFIAESVRATFDRQSGQLALTRRRVFGTTVVTIPLATIRAVGVEQWLEAHATDHTRRVILVTDERTIPLTRYLYNDGGACVATANKIKHFLRGSP